MHFCLFFVKYIIDLISDLKSESKKIEGQYESMKGIL